MDDVIVSLRLVLQLERAPPACPSEAPHWVKVKNPKAPAVTREAEEAWGR
jgi:hypothetical protein